LPRIAKKRGLGFERGLVKEWFEFMIRPPQKEEIPFEEFRIGIFRYHNLLMRVPEGKTKFANLGKDNLTT
jgi:hypothetical protein